MAAAATRAVTGAAGYEEQGKEKPDQQGTSGWWNLDRGSQEKTTFYEI